MKRNTSKTWFWLGFAIVLLSHLLMIWKGITASMLIWHALVNIIACILMAIGYVGKPR